MWVGCVCSSGQRSSRCFFLLRFNNCCLHGINYCSVFVALETIRKFLCVFSSYSFSWICLVFVAAVSRYIFWHFALLEIIDWIGITY